MKHNWRNQKHIRTNIINMTLIACLSGITLSGCGGGGGEEDCSDGHCGGGGPTSSDPIEPTVDLSGAEGLLVVDTSNGSSSRVASIHNSRVAKFGLPSAAGRLGKQNFRIGGSAASVSASDDSSSSSTEESQEDSLVKTDSDGDIQPALDDNQEPADPKMGGWQPKLPRISTIFVSPDPYKEVFLHFENSFKNLPGDDNTGGDPQSSGLYCQLFRVKGGTADDLTSLASGPQDLECLTYDLTIDNWQAQRESIFQSDGAGNIYFTGRIGHSMNSVVVKWDRLTGAITEIVNSNVCVQDFLVTESGGVFYTGTTSCQGGGSSGGFFRYASAGGTLYEIARNWWSFVFEAQESATTDKAIFFGPDPRTATTASWQTAGLFYFDPLGGDETSERVSEVLTSASDIWSWMQMRRDEDTDAYGEGFSTGEQDPSSAWLTEFSERCTSSGQLFVGGGSQISAIKQDSQGNIFVIGNARLKSAGEISCNVEVRGPHCLIDSDPDPTYTTEATCTAAAGTWDDDGYCDNGSYTTAATCFAGSSTWRRNGTWYNNVTSDICTNTASKVTNDNWWSATNSVSFQTATSATENVMKFRLSGMDCGFADGETDWTQEYLVLGKVDPDTKSLTMLSTVNEQALDLYLVNDEVFYAAYNASSGQYLLRKYSETGTTDVMTNFEAYHLKEAGEGSGLAYFDGLDFSNNSYTFGTVTTAAPHTATAKTGLTGQIKTIVIMGE